MLKQHKKRKKCDFKETKMATKRRLRSDLRSRRVQLPEKKPQLKFDSLDTCTLRKGRCIVSLSGYRLKMTIK
jgi:hypothetical protein